MTRQEQIENHFKGGEKTNKNLVALQTYVKNYIEDHYPAPYTQYEVISIIDADSRAQKALYDLLDDNPPFLMQFTSLELREFNFYIEYKYKSDIRSAFRNELYGISDVIRKARKSFKRGDYFSYDKETKHYTIGDDSPLVGYKFIEADTYYLKKDRHGSYECFIVCDGEDRYTTCFSSLIEAAHNLPEQLSKSYSKLEKFLEDACHRGLDDLLSLCHKDYSMRRLSDKVLNDFIDSYERPAPRKYGVYKFKPQGRFFVDINEEERLKLSPHRGVADIIVNNIPYLEAVQLRDKLQGTSDFWYRSIKLQKSIDRMTELLEKEMEMLDEVGDLYLESIRDIKDSYGVQFQELMTE